MRTVEEAPQYTKLINRPEVKKIEFADLTLLVALLTTILEIGLPRSEKEKAKVITKAKPVLDSYPELKMAVIEELGEEFLNSVFASVLTSN